MWRYLRARSSQLGSASTCAALRHTSRERVTLGEGALGGGLPMFEWGSPSHLAQRFEFIALVVAPSLAPPGERANRTILGG